MSKKTNNFLDTISIDKKKYAFFNLNKVSKEFGSDLKKLPYTYRNFTGEFIKTKKN